MQLYDLIQELAMLYNQIGNVPVYTCDTHTGIYARPIFCTQREVNKKEAGGADILEELHGTLMVKISTE